MLLTLHHIFKDKANIIDSKFNDLMSTKVMVYASFYDNHEIF